MRSAAPLPLRCAAAAPRRAPLARPRAAPHHTPLRRALANARRRTAVSASALPLPPPPHAAPPAAPPPPGRLLLLRRVALVAITLRIVLFTPVPALTSSLALGILGAALSSRGALMAAAAAVRDALPPLPPPSPAGGSSSPSPLLRGAVLSGRASALVGVAVFVLAGLCEIGGGWLVWQALRCGRPRWWAALGSALLVAYGFVAAMQPVASFGRAFALYGGYFVLMSIGWGAALDGFKPDAGDAVGCVLIAAGVAVMTAWPRSGGL